jgi:hypothetical protein
MSLDARTAATTGCSLPSTVVRSIVVVFQSMAMHALDVKKKLVERVLNLLH